MAETFAVDQRGIGKPDYSKEVSSARQRAGLSLQYLEAIGVLVYVATDQVAHPSPIAGVQPPIPIGGTVNMIDAQTGVATPYTIPQGYTMAVIQEAWTQNNDVEIWWYFDGNLYGAYIMGQSGQLEIEELIAPFDSAWVDPTGAAAHTYDVQIVNVSGALCEGAWNVLLLLTAVGTPPWPTTKDCKCPFCGHLQTVPRTQTYIICEECGKLYIVRDLSKIRKT